MLSTGMVLALLFLLLGPWEACFSNEPWIQMNTWQVQSTKCICSQPEYCLLKWGWYKRNICNRKTAKRMILWREGRRKWTTEQQQQKKGCRFFLSRRQHVGYKVKFILRLHAFLFCPKYYIFKIAVYPKCDCCIIKSSNALLESLYSLSIVLKTYIRLLIVEV